MIIGLYNKSGLSQMKQELTELLEKTPDRNIVISDWNARIGTLGDRSGSCEERNTRDRITNEEGTKWNNFMAMQGLELLNGNTEGDWDGEYTHDGYQGSSVIHYACSSTAVIDEIVHFTVESRTESAHQPIVLRWGQKTEEEYHDRKHNRRLVQDWNEKSIAVYHRRLELYLQDHESPTWKNVEECITKATVWKGIAANNEKRWFDKECYQMRQEKNIK